jgi:hypothetical protein
MNFLLFLQLNFPLQLGYSFLLQRQLFTHQTLDSLYLLQQMPHPSLTSIIAFPSIGALLLKLQLLHAHFGLVVGVVWFGE